MNCYSQEQLVQKFLDDKKKRSWIMRMLLVLDQLGNVLFWNGSQDETISSHIGRRIKGGRAYFPEKILCNILKRFESNHCHKSLGE